MTGYRFLFHVCAGLALCVSTSAFAGFHYAPFVQDAPNHLIRIKTAESPAMDFITHLTKRGIGIIEKDGVSDTARQKEFRKLLQTGFDMKTIARFSLGRYWRTASAAEQKEYLKLFEDMIVSVYARRFSDYNGEKINVLSARPEGKADHIVTSVLVPESGPDVDILWRVRQNKSGQFRVVDVIVEGVSMSMTQRADFASVIQRGGGQVGVLLAHLRDQKN